MLRIADWSWKGLRRLWVVMLAATLIGAMVLCHFVSPYRFNIPNPVVLEALAPPLSVSFFSLLLTSIVFLWIDRPLARIGFYILIGAFSWMLLTPTTTNCR